MSSLAVAISLYDRWDELQGLLELLRLNWKTGKELYIAVTSTAEEDAMPGWVNRSLVDTFSFGSTYTLPAKRSSRWTWLHDRRYGEFKRLLRARTVDSIQRGGRACANSGKDYALHLHAAAWPLKEDFIAGVIEHMEKHQFVVGCRGYGKKLVDGKHPAGDIDDNFFLINNEFARQTHFWDFDPAQDAERIGNEGRLARRVYEVAREDQVYYFDDFSRSEDYIFPPSVNQRRVQPYNYHKPTGLLRSHDMRKQAELVAQFGFHGPWLDQMLAKQQAQLYDKNLGR